jgi:parallel beta-helix repeat protein
MRQQHIITAMLIGWQLHQGAAALGAIWTVDDDGDADFNSIQAAVDVASNGDEVVVEPGTYTGGDLYVVDMAGKGITLRASSSSPEDTIIDGEGVRGGIICFTGENKDTVIDGFTITRGSTSSGGGVLCSASSPTLRNCIITGNTASTSGGGVYCFDGDPILESCWISNNEAGLSGGGVYLWNSNPKMTSIQILANEAPLGAGMRCISSSTPRLAVCKIDGNIASNRGGGVSLHESSPVLSGCDITNNTSGSDGGGISSEFGSHPVFASCLISGNTSAKDGGGFFSSELDPNSSTLSDCTITMNFATRLGGGIYRTNSDKEMLLSISTVCGNNPDQINGDFTRVDSAIYDNWYGCPSECVGDVDANGTIDIFDLLPVLENWGVCP